MDVILFFNKPAAVAFFVGKPNVRVRVDSARRQICLLPTARKHADDLVPAQQSHRGGLKVPVSGLDFIDPGAKLTILPVAYGWLCLRPAERVSKNEAHARLGRTIRRVAKSSEEFRQVA